MIDINGIISWIKDYFVNSNGKKAVIGISGGKDSTVALGLLCKAIGPENVIAVKMPCGEQEDINDANDIIKYFEIPSYNVYEVNIGDICNTSYAAIENADIQVYTSIVTNLPARIRMTILYAIASQYHGRVVNTGNLSEAFVGYTTKFGDGAGDFAILANYTVREVKEIGMILQIPPKWLEKTPSDGMCGKSDEENLGFSYDILDNLIMEDIRPDIEVYNHIMSLYKRNIHKNIDIPTCPWFNIEENGRHRRISRRGIDYETYYF